MSRVGALSECPFQGDESIHSAGDSTSPPCAKQGQCRGLTGSPTRAMCVSGWEVTARHTEQGSRLSHSCIPVRVAVHTLTRSSYAR